MCFSGLELTRAISKLLNSWRKIDKPIVMHYGSGCCHVVTDPKYDPGVTAAVQIREEMQDGFVLGGGDVDEIKTMASVANEVRKPFWIQSSVHFLLPMC